MSLVCGCGIHEVIFAGGAEEASVGDEAGVEGADADAAWLGLGVRVGVGLRVGLRGGLRVGLRVGVGVWIRG